MPDRPTEDLPPADERGSVVPFPTRFAPAAFEPDPLSPEEEARIAEAAARAAEETAAAPEAELRRTLASLDPLRARPRSAVRAHPPCTNLRDEIERALANIANARRLVNGTR